MVSQDIRFSFRTFRRSPGFFLIAAVVLALGIGATTAIFSVVHGVLLAPLNYRDAERIVALNTKFTREARQIPRLTGADYVDIRSSAKSLEAVSYYFGGEVGVQFGDRADFSEVAWVTPPFFAVFGTTPTAGHVFEGKDGETSTVVSAAFAERNFGGVDRALGKTIHIENRAYDIAGVLPAGFNAPNKTNIWLPAPKDPSNLNRTSYNYRAAAKVAAGVPVSTAQAELESIGARLAAAYPTNKEKSFTATPLRDQTVAPVRSTLYVLLGAVFLILLIACANVAHLLLARAASRSREIAVRTAIGASRWRIVRQLVVESLVLGTCGGALGILLAQFGTAALVRFAPANLPRVGDVHVDGTVLAFAILLSIAASLLFGLAPAWQTSRVDVNDALKQGGSRGMIGGRSSALRNTLVIAEIALSFVLAIGGGLLFRSFLALNTVQLGYRTSGVLVMYAHAPAAELNEYIRVPAAAEQKLFPQLAAIPGVVSVAAAMGLPTGEYSSDGLYAVEGKHSFNELAKLPHAGFRLASPRYFSTMGIPLIRGREFSERDAYDGQFVAIVSESLVRQTFPHEDPIGKRLMCGLDSDKWMTIVGVVGDVRQQSPASAPGPEMYMPLQQHPYHANEMQVVLRTAVEPASLIDAVRRTTQAQNPEIATKFTTMDAMVSDSIATPRFRTLLVGVFATLALVLAMAGVYGVMTFIAAQRTSEFGLRLALGASAFDVMRLIFVRALVLACTGLAIGLALSFALSRVMASFLFGLEAMDAITYAGISVLVALTTAAAAAIPAWKAMRVDPVVALRQE
jgi:putative ABC transport system permease protein